MSGWDDFVSGFDDGDAGFEFGNKSSFANKYEHGEEHNPVQAKTFLGFVKDFSDLQREFMKHVISLILHLLLLLLLLQ